MIKIATQIFSEETFTLQDGEEVTVRPLTIKYLRKFMKEIGKLSETNEDGTPKLKEDEMMETIFNAAKIALQKGSPELAKNPEIDDILDMPTVYKIIEVAGGVKLNDPNQVVAG